MTNQVLPDNNNSHTSRTNILLSASINQAVFADINWLAAKIAAHISNENFVTDSWGVFEFNTLDGFVVAVVDIPVMGLVLC